MVQCSQQGYCIIPGIPITSQSMELAVQNLYGLKHKPSHCIYHIHFSEMCPPLIQQRYPSMKIGIGLFRFMSCLISYDVDLPQYA